MDAAGTPGSELVLARCFVPEPPFEGLSDEQLSLIMNRGRRLYKTFKTHPYIHNLVNSAVILFIFTADFLSLIWLPRLLLSAHHANSLGSILLAAFLAGSLHSWLMYSLLVFSLHEGAAHKLTFVGSGRLARFANFIGANLCRVGGGEPQHYATCHMSHHAKFGSEEDSEFLNFIMPRRYWLTFLPLAAFINFSDFVIHRPLTYTPSRIISGVLAVVYNGPYAYIMYRLFGLEFMAITMLIFVPHFGFYMDRLRQFTEHNLMPLENKNGARSFGIGFWGILVGGGPWGQPCHWAHHLVASIPWYHQIVLHRYIVGLLTPCQRRQFLIQPWIGFPKLWWGLLRDSRRMLRRDPPVALRTV